MNKLTPLPSGTMIDCSRISSVQPKPNENKILVTMNEQPSPTELSDPVDFPPFLEELENLGHNVSKIRDLFKIPAPPKRTTEMPSRPSDKITFYDVT